MTGNPETERTVILEKVPIELCKLLKFEGLAGTGGEAKFFITQGLVRVNGEVETRKRKKIMPGDIIEFRGTRLKIGIAGN